MPGENGGVEGKRFVNMWADVVKLAAKHRATALVKKGCAVLRRLSWRLESNRELILLLADIDLVLVEALALDVASTELLDDEEEELPEDEGKEDDSSKLLAAEVGGVGFAGVFACSRGLWRPCGHGLNIVLCVCACVREGCCLCMCP